MFAQDATSLTVAYYRRDGKHCFRYTHCNKMFDLSTLPCSDLSNHLTTIANVCMVASCRRRNSSRSRACHTTLVYLVSPALKQSPPNDHASPVGLIHLSTSCSPVSSLYGSECPSTFKYADHVSRWYYDDCPLDIFQRIPWQGRYLGLSIGWSRHEQNSLGACRNLSTMERVSKIVVRSCTGRHALWLSFQDMIGPNGLGVFNFLAQKISFPVSRPISDHLPVSKNIECNLLPWRSYICPCCMVPKAVVILFSTYGVKYDEKCFVGLGSVYSLHS